MKYLLLSILFALLAATVRAATTDDRKAVIVSYPTDTPDSVIQDAKAAIINAGGTITHEYRLIKAFAAEAGEGALEVVHTAGAAYNALIESDSQVHANNFRTT